MKAIIIDDEALARDLIKSFLIDHPQVEIIGECADGFQGIKIIQEYTPDIIFLDIQMPKLTGFEMLELIEEPPIVIFTTAYSEHAIEAFEKNAIDYLLKPFSRDRFKKAMEKAGKKFKSKEKHAEPLKKLMENSVKESGSIERIVVKTGSKVKVIPTDEIIYLEAQDDYVMIYCSKGKFLKQQTMKYFEEALNSSEFIRIHRSYIFNIQFMDRIEPYEKESHRLILKNNAKLPVSKSGYARLKEVLKF